MTREDFVPRLVSLLDGRPVRWAGPSQTIGDYDGRERTLEVFNADASEQRDLLRRLRPIREELAAITGGPVVVIFHTRKESARLYRAVIEHHRAAQLDTVGRRLRELLPEATLEVVGSERELPRHLRVQLDGRCVVITGALEAGFDMWLATEPPEGHALDFRITDIERACRSVALLLVRPKRASLAEKLAHGSPDPAAEAANLDTADLKVEDQVVDKGARNPPRKAA
jgi:hypothetical protein